MDSFNTRPTGLNSVSLDKLQHVLDYRCIVGGGEQVFLLGLGVRNISTYVIFTQLTAYVYSSGSVFLLYRRHQSLKRVFVCVEISDLHLGR